MAEDGARDASLNTGLSGNTDSHSSVNPEDTSEQTGVVTNSDDNLS